MIILRAWGTYILVISTSRTKSILIGEEVSDTQNRFSMLRTTDQTVMTGNCAGTRK